MKAKLIKEKLDIYGLKVDGKIIATNDAEVNKRFNYPYTLSIKNCQAIENGYDFDELTEQNWGIGLEEYTSIPVTHITNFKASFQKSVDLMKLKFGEETEWDVEIIQEPAKHDCGPGETNWYNLKLDNEECLILKRK